MCVLDVSVESNCKIVHPKVLFLETFLTLYGGSDMFASHKKFN